MSELVDYLKERFLPNNKSAMEESLAIQKVKRSIMATCEKYLTEVGARYTFEVPDAYLGYAIEVIGMEPLSTRYDIIQVGVNLFQATLKEIDIDDIFQ